VKLQFTGVRPLSADCIHTGVRSCMHPCLVECIACCKLPATGAPNTDNRRRGATFALSRPVPTINHNISLLYRACSFSCTKMSTTYTGRQIGFDTLSHELQTFREGLTDEQVAAFEAIDLGELEVTLEAIQNKQRSDCRMQDLRRLEQFLKTIDSYCEFLLTCGYTDALELVAFVWVRQSVKN